MIGRGLALLVETLERAHVAAHVLSGSAVIYKANLEAPLKIVNQSGNLLVQNCTVIAPVPDPLPNFVPERWSK